MRWRIRGVLAAVILAGGLTAALFARADVPQPTIQVTGRFADVRPRIDLAVRESIDQYSRWLLPAPAAPLLVRVEPTWRRQPAAMNIEQHIAYEVARQWFGRTDSAAVNGIAWYLQSRVVERLYDYAFHQPGHSGLVSWSFGRTVGVELPLLRRSRWTAGVGRYSSRAWPDLRPFLPASVDRPVMRTAAALAALERQVGWPVLQGALFEANRLSQTRALSRAELGQVLSDAIGVDATAILQGSEREQDTDYAINDVTSTPCARPDCIQTRVVVAGSDSSSPLVVRVEFADGQAVDATWDGKGTRSVEFESRSPYAAVHLDPDRLAVSDSNLLNNVRLASPSSNVPTGKWTARWIVWLQDAMLAYSAGL